MAPDLAHIGPIHVVDWLGLMIYMGVPGAIVYWGWGLRRLEHLAPSLEPAQAD